MPKKHTDGRIHLLIKVLPFEKTAILVIDMKDNGLEFHSLRPVLKQFYNLVVIDILQSFAGKKEMFGRVGAIGVSALR